MSSLSLERSVRTRDQFHFQSASSPPSSYPCFFKPVWTAGDETMPPAENFCSSVSKHAVDGMSRTRPGEKVKGLGSCPVFVLPFRGSVP